MNLKSLDEIKKDGLTVFMPSGFQATLFLEDENVLVKYGLKTDTYSKKDFQKIMDEGIFIFNDMPQNFPQIMESYGWSVSELELGDSGFDSPEEAYQNAKMCLEDSDYEVGDFDGEGFSVYDPGNEEMGYLPFDGYGVIESDEEDMDESYRVEDEKGKIVKRKLPTIDQAIFWMNNQKKKDEEKGKKHEYSIFAESLNEAVKVLNKTEQKIRDILADNGYKVSETETKKGEYVKLFYVDKDVKLDGNQHGGEEVKGKDLREILKKLQDKFSKNESLNEKYNDGNPDSIIYNKLTQYMMELGDPADILPEDCTIDDIITWIFEHNKEAYTKSFWIDTFKMTEKDLDKYHISDDLDESLNEEEVEKYFYGTVSDGTRLLVKAKDSEEAINKLGNEFFCPELKFDSIEDCDKEYDEIIDESLNEGMWASPFTIENANKIKELLSKPITFAELSSEKSKKELWDIIGDDEFWDDVDDFAIDFPENDARSWISERLRNWIERKQDFTPRAYSDEAEKIIKDALVEAYNDAFDIHRYYVTFDGCEGQVFGARSKEEARELAQKDFFTKDFKITGIEDLGPLTEPKNESVNSIASDLRNGNKSGKDEEFGEWLLETSLDSKWEALTDNIKYLILFGIADEVEGGNMNMVDFAQYFDNSMDLTKEDLKSLDMFTDEEIDAMFSTNGYLECYLSYQIKHTEDNSEIEESLMEKFVKKGYIRESVANADIKYYLGTTDQGKTLLVAGKDSEEAKTNSKKFFTPKEVFNSPEECNKEYDELIDVNEGWTDFSNQKTLEFLGINQNDFNSKQELIKYIEENTDYDVLGSGDYWLNIIDRTENDGKEIQINLENKMREAFEKTKRKEGDVFKALKNKKKEYLTPEFKNELLTSLDKIAREMPNVKIRQQAVTFMDELGLQEYYDTKKVQAFIKKNLKVLNAKVNESLNEDLSDEELDEPRQYCVYIRDEEDNVKSFCQCSSLREAIEQYMELLDYIDEEKGEFVCISEGHDADNHVIRCSLDESKAEQFKEKKKGKKKKKLDEKGENGMEKVRDWYMSAYPTDDLGPDINPDVTFDDIYADLPNVYDLLGQGDSIIRERVFEKLAELKKVDYDVIYYGWLNDQKLNESLCEDAYKVYNSIENRDCGTFNSWDEVDDFLNREWNEYKASMVKENPEFGTDEQRDAFFGNYDMATVQLPVVVEEPVEEPAAEVCPKCGETECVCQAVVEPAVVEVDVPVEVAEDFEDEHIGKSEEPVEETPIETEEITTPEEAAEVLDDVEDKIDNIEDYIKTLLEEPEEELKESKEKSEDFKDNMGMLTDINDLDFPDALQNAVDTKEDGSLYRISDVAKMVQELKTEIESIKDEFKSALAELKQGIKDDVKDIQNDVTSKLDNTDSKIADLTSEEEALEEEPIEEPVEEVEEETPAEETENEEEGMEESLEEMRKNPIYNQIREVFNSNKHPKGLISVATVAEKIRENYGTDTKNQFTYDLISEICKQAPEFKKHVVDVDVEKSTLKESMLGKAAKWISGGLMGALAQEKQKKSFAMIEEYKKQAKADAEKQNEDANEIKKEIDKLAAEGKNDKIKPVIDVMSDNQAEKEEATKYAIEKVQESKANELLAKLKNTSRTATFSNLNIRG